MSSLPGQRNHTTRHRASGHHEPDTRPRLRLALRDSTAERLQSSGFTGVRVKARPAGFGKAFQCDRFEGQGRKGLSDHLAGAWLFLTVFFFFPHGHSTSPVTHPLCGAVQKLHHQCSGTGCHTTLLSSLPGNFPSINTAGPPSK